MSGRVGKGAPRRPESYAPARSAVPTAAPPVSTAREAVESNTRLAGRLCPAYGAILVALAAFFTATTAHAQPRRDPGEIHGLKLGRKAEEMPPDPFGALACGSNGGPPRQ